MRTKFFLTAALAALVALALVPSAGAKSSYIFVKTTPSAVDLCRPLPEQVGFRFEFKAKITRRNSKRPKNVRIQYKVTDAATGTVLTTGKVTLTARNKYKKKSAPILVPAGASLVYNFISVYNAPSSGKRVTAKGQQTDQIPTAAQLDTIQPPLPSVCV